MASRSYRLAYLICCDTCGREWFGATGEDQARKHAADFHHQVRINALVRETLNEVSQGNLPSYESPLAITSAEKKLRRSAAIARLEGIYGVEP